eukprot:1582777-Rhodomonas_salina.2
MTLAKSAQHIAKDADRRDQSACHHSASRFTPHASLSHSTHHSQATEVFCRYTPRSFCLLPDASVSKRTSVITGTEGGPGADLDCGEGDGTLVLEGQDGTCCAEACRKRRLLDSTMCMTASEYAYMRLHVYCH